MKRIVLVILLFISLTNAASNFKENEEYLDEDLIQEQQANFDAEAYIDIFDVTGEENREKCLEYGEACRWGPENPCCQPTGIWSYWYKEYACVCYGSINKKGKHRSLGCACEAHG